MWFKQPGSIWRWLDTLSGQRLSLGSFHNLARDTVIFSIIWGNILLNSVITIGALIVFYFRRLGWLMVIMALDMAVNTQGLLYYAQADIYNQTQATDSQLMQKIDDLKSPQLRWLTRNMNQPYTDFGMYWEAMTTRAPFSDSFIDTAELTDNTTLKRLRDGATPDWNMTRPIPIVNGYTTLLPLDYAKLWTGPTETRINFLGTIDPTTPLAHQWAVKYYLVDTSFHQKEDLTALPTVYEDKTFQVKEIPGALPRFRFGNGQIANLQDFTETPNRVTFKVTSDKPQELIMADRYDPNWQATVNGADTPLLDQAGMRQISLAAGRQTVVFAYRPRWFYIGSLLTLITGIGMWGWWMRYNRK
jgi:hypothetical protein